MDATGSSSQESLPPSAYSEVSNPYSDSAHQSRPALSFPPRSPGSSASSLSSEFQEEQPAQSRGPFATTSHTGHITADPLSRNYPKPAEDVNVAEAVAREPLKWTIGYWAKHAREQQPPVLSKEVQTKKLGEAKRELLEAKAEMARRLSKPRDTWQ